MRTLSAFLLAINLISGLGAASSPTPKAQTYTDTDAKRMIQASETTLSPVYGPLAEHMVTHLQLAEKHGVGIDIGSGPGTLIIELCKRTRLHWINADINPHFFDYFHTLARKTDLCGRVSAIVADVHYLPFRDDYADVIVSRGSYWSWTDGAKAMAEIYRVLKPGAVAYIGRGFSENLPQAIVKQIRAKQGKNMKYSFEEKASELKALMKKLEIESIASADIKGQVDFYLTEGNHQAWESAALTLFGESTDARAYFMVIFGQPGRQGNQRRIGLYENQTSKRPN